jgi:hypothetical protein
VVVDWRHEGRRAATEVSLLAGFIRCHGCGELMWRSHGAKPGQQAFRCSARWQGVKCPRPVTVRCDYVEPFVEEQLIDRMCATSIRTRLLGTLQFNRSRTRTNRPLRRKKFEAPSVTA